MFRLFRNQHKAKTKLRVLLVFQLSAIFSLTAAICLQFTGDTSAAFYDIENFDVSLQTCENFQHTDKNCHYDKRWDQSDLHVVNQTDTKVLSVPLFVYLPSWKTEARNLRNRNGSGSFINWQTPANR